MTINDKDIELENVVAKEESFLKRRSNGLMLSDEDIQILETYNINYLKYHTLEELIFEITQILNEYSGDIVPLEELNIKLGEYNYYHYTNK